MGDLMSPRLVGPSRRVSLVYRVVPHYRVAFYEGLRDRLRTEGVELRLLVGQPDAGESSRADTAQLEGVEPLRRHHLEPPGVGTGFEWQEVLKATRQDDLVIVEDAVRLASNAALLVRRALRRGPPVALWGHGTDLQGGDGGLKGVVRRVSQRNTDWYFAYTDEVVERVVDHGVPRQRTTNVMNTIDTNRFLGELAAVTEADIASFRQQIGAGEQAPIGLYCGGLIPDKRLRFLLEAGRAIVAQRPDFQLVIVGSGPLRPKIEAAAAEHAWVHYLGPQFGSTRAVAFAASDVVLMPGLVGLVVVDAQLAGSPVITTADARHSPEIAYLEHDRTGLVLPPGSTSTDYAREVVRLLGDGPRLQAYRDAGRAASRALTTERMVEQFASGVCAALGLETRSVVRQ